MPVRSGFKLTARAKGYKATPEEKQGLLKLAGLLQQHIPIAAGHERRIMRAFRTQGQRGVQAYVTIMKLRFTTKKASKL